MEEGRPVVSVTHHLVSVLALVVLLGAIEAPALSFLPLIALAHMILQRYERGFFEKHDELCDCLLRRLRKGVKYLV